MIVNQTLTFKNKVKKLLPKEKLKLDEEIKKILKNPKLGEEKKGDLKGVFVYKFSLNRQKYLLAYSFFENELILLAFGSHENFYQRLKGF